MFTCINPHINAQAQMYVHVHTNVHKYIVLISNKCPELHQYQVQGNENLNTQNINCFSLPKLP